MMGTKGRDFAPLVDVSLEELVPADSFYRHLEGSLDLSFVRELVKESYSLIGRPSIDPVVFFKLQLCMFFEGVRSERQLMRHAADRLSIRWYLGYDLCEPLPDHSSLTKIREPGTRAGGCGSKYSDASSMRSWSDASRRGWCGAGSCTSTPPR